MTDEHAGITEIFLDEAGYTGPDLVNRDQPVFVLASTIIDAVEARELLDSCFGANRQAEVKHSRFSRSQRGRSRILDLIQQLAPDSGRFAFHVVHKEYTLLGFLIDFWLEPMMRLDGINLYERGQNIALVNVSYVTLEETLGPEGRRELLRRFQVMTRDRTNYTYNSFWDSLRDATGKYNLIDEVLGPLLLAEQRLGYSHLLQLPTHLLDLGEYSLLVTVECWRNKVPDGTFILIHDDSAMINRNLIKWEAVLDPSNPPDVVGQDRRTISFPLPVRGLRIEQSHQFAQLQIADIIAGAARVLMSAKATGTMSEYAEALEGVGLLQTIIGGVWPSNAVTPQELETEGPVLRDTAEFIGELIKRHSSP